MPIPVKEDSSKIEMKKNIENFNQKIKQTTQRDQTNDSKQDMSQPVNPTLEQHQDSAINRSEIQESYISDKDIENHDNVSCKSDRNNNFQYPVIASRDGFLSEEIISSFLFISKVSYIQLIKFLTTHFNQSSCANFNS